ncbi:TraR/DksA family transcriptional regulator [Nocardioides mangrovicus]|uniref:TraR/DksA family transcriptional regulator n=1 Tax=Nocardioides mangrovicus TaxID=2478913 RepID=UPI001E31D492|nr:TraR/DksA C4-type zinc finger protein [Nocardioides mangrovicus]
MPEPADHLAERLAEQRRRIADLERSLAAVHAASESSNADDEHDPEGATIAFERQQLVALLETARRTAAALEAAATRTGPVLCERCGRPIDPARLEVRPQATTCVGCAS